jgi:hypothetical protein
MYDSPVQTAAAAERNTCIGPLCIGIVLKAVVPLKRAK